ncbi:MFS transporter [Patulibacter defluvii]|uniref:MFS transporter n=1 Tax=Patulibacter defluvii TaxID=3095358 RepID=UPI002A750F57|nr:MFS transporter [Patulibacter sp. DM4]
MASDEAAAERATWGALFDRAHRAAVTVFAGGVALYAVNVYLTTSLLPNAVDEIGGFELYAWTMTIFLVASVFTSMLVSQALVRYGARNAYGIGLVLFAAGSVVAAAAPTMTVLLVGRALQGLGGGLLAGLGFALVRTILPPRLWQRAIALMSAMWGVGNVIGPLLGGLFAEIDLWRGAFVLLALTAVAIGVVAWRSLPARHETDGRAAPVPWIALGLLATGAAAVSVSSVVDGSAPIALLLAVAFGLLVTFVARERRSSVRVLPELTYRRGSALRWIYLSIAVLAVGSTVETFLPLFGQRLGGLSPLGAGLLGASLSWGWSIASILNGGVTDPRAKDLNRIAGPLVLAVGLVAYTALQTPDPDGLRIALWFATLIVAGAGIGMAFAHWIPAAMGISPDPEQANKAAAGVNTVQLIANAFGSAVAGVLVTIGGPGILGSAHLLGYGYAMVALLGAAVALPGLARRRAPSSAVAPAYATRDGG